MVVGLRRLMHWLPPPLEISPRSVRQSPMGGRGDGHQVKVSGGGGGDRKGISRQTVVPSTDEATWVMQPPQLLALRVKRSHDPL